MKRNEAKWTVLALAVLLVLTQGSDARDKKKSVKSSNAPKIESGALNNTFFGYVPVPAKVEPVEVDRELVKNLVDILNSTESSTTFALTVMALDQLGDKAKATVPSIIRNAERLKIFSGTNAVAPPNTLPSKKQQIANAIAQSIVNLLNGNRPPQAMNPPVCARTPTEAQVLPPQPQHVPPSPPYGPTSY